MNSRVAVCSVDRRTSCGSMNRSKIGRRTGERAKDELANDQSDGTGLADRPTGLQIGWHACGADERDRRAGQTGGTDGRDRRA